jgi:hypothetical protein
MAGLDQSGLLAGLLMVALVVAVSFAKPIAFARYFIILLPGLVVWLSLCLARLEPSGPRVKIAIVFGLILWVVISWSQSFLGMTSLTGSIGSREDSNFQQVSLLAAPYPLRYGYGPRHLTTSDRLLASQGALPDHRYPWREVDELSSPDILKNPSPFIVAATGGDRLLREKFEPQLNKLKRLGFLCRDLAVDQPHLRVLVCASSRADSLHENKPVDASRNSQARP